MSNMSVTRSSKVIVFVAVMGALGNVLSFISIKAAPLLPHIPLGPISVSVAIDLSHVATFIAALFGGPAVGGLTGLVGGAVAANEFGFSQGNIITGFGLPVGKAMTGFMAGLIIRYFGIMEGRRIRIVLVTLASWVPEGVFTSLLFLVIFPPVYGMPVMVAKIITAQILVKAIVEMIVMGLILAGLLGNRGFTEYVRGVFA